MLVSYSDSEGSDDESKKNVTKPASKPAVQAPNSNFALDRATGKIKVNLHAHTEPAVNGSHEDEPVAKKPRLGGGNAFSGFNAMLPAPKRDNLPPAQNGSAKTPARKVFSLRTGAEPTFSRESNVELSQLFAGQGTDDPAGGAKTDISVPSSIPKPSFAKPASPAPAGKAFMFKPLSVARNTKKKKPAPGLATSIPAPAPQLQGTAGPQPDPVKEPPKKKISLFSAGADTALPVQVEDEEDEIIEDLGPAEADDSLDSFSVPSQQQLTPQDSQSQSLDNIASDLNLSAAERRQLFGRTGKAGASAINVVNFNTDEEYAANQQLISAGEQVQHNPVRAIASGKHSLRQLVSSAANQKDALEESFAMGKRNKKEAGNKYGW